MVVIDVRLPDGDGIEVGRRVREMAPDARCMVLSAFVDGELVARAKDAGMEGYVLKHLHRGEIVDAIRRFHAGETVFGDGVDMSGETPAPGPDDDTRRLGTLTDLERRVLELVAAGLTNRQIGQELDVAEKTAKKHVSSVLAKLGVPRRTGAAVFHARAVAN